MSAHDRPGDSLRPADLANLRHDRSYLRPTVSFHKIELHFSQRIFRERIPSRSIFLLILHSAFAYPAFAAPFLNAPYGFIYHANECGPFAALASLTQSSSRLRDRKPGSIPFGL